MTEPHAHLKRRSMLRIQQLDMLLHLMETRSVSETAEKLGLTQSAVTKSLKELESGFSVRLFDRTSRGLRPTPYAEVLERFAHDTLIGLQSAYETIRGLRFGERGHVGVGLVPGVGQRLAACMLRRLRDAHPELHVELQVDLTEPLLEALHSGSIDVALVHPPSSLDPARFRYLPAGNETLYALVHPHHPHHPLLAVEVHKRIGEGIAWALPPRNELLRQLVDTAVVRAGYPPPHDVIELPLHAGAADLAHELDVIVVLPESLALPHLQQGALQRLELPFDLPGLPLGLLRARHADASVGADIVLRELSEAVRNLATATPPDRRVSDRRQTWNVA